ncbi:MAG: hypothetical protein Q4D81_04220 [Eubacteriales bacterium]|nr:hypothetical protein [Eubacteriales bacterium]
MKSIVRTNAERNTGPQGILIHPRTASFDGNAGIISTDHAWMSPCIPEFLPEGKEGNTAAKGTTGTAGKPAGPEKAGEAKSPRASSGREKSLSGKMGVKLFGPSSRIRDAACPDTGDLLRFMKKLYNTAGTKDPRAVAEMLDIIVSDLEGSITGYATVIRTEGNKMLVPVIGLNIKLDESMYIMAGAHEITHVVDGHVYNISSGSRLDEGSLFLHGIDSRCLSWDERRCNLVAADIYLEDEDVFQAVGFRNRHMHEYREILAQQKQLAKSRHRYLYAGFPYNEGSVCFPEKARVRAEAYWRSVRELEERRIQEEACLLQLNLMKSFSETAAELGVTETILHYKLEAMRLRGLDIDRQELASYSRVFENALKQSREFCTFVPQ